MPRVPTLAEFKIFLASPGDVPDERERTAKLIASLGNAFRPAGVLPVLLRSDNVRARMGRPQALINPQVHECDLFVGILNRNWGTHTGEFTSGFEEEFRLAETRREKTGSPEISLFVRDRLTTSKAKELEAFLDAVKGRLKWDDYSSSEQYERLLNELLLPFLIASAPVVSVSSPLGAEPAFDHRFAPVASVTAVPIDVPASQGTLEPTEAVPLRSSTPARGGSWTRAALGSSKLPTIAEWDDRFQRAYDDHHSEYSAYKDRLFHPDFAPADDAERLEQIICLSIEREPARALRALSALNTHDWPKPRLIALSRLKGVLSFEIGDSQGAIAAYENALALAKGFDEATKAVRFDLLRLAQRSLEDELASDPWEEVRAMPGWVGAPAEDHAVKHFGDAFAKMLFFETVRPESSHRFSSGDRDFVRQYNLALAVAYFIGDMESVQAARTSFARQAGTLAKVTDQAKLGVMALEEAIASGNSNVAKELLRAMGSTIARELGEEAEAMVRKRPALPDGAAAERFQMMRLELIGGLGPYLKDESRAELIRELADAARAYLTGDKSDGNMLSAICGRHQRAQTYFTEPFARVAQFEKSELTELVRALTSSDETPNDRFSLWAMALHADWAAMPSAVVASAVERLQEWPFSSDELNLALTLLSHIRAEVPARKPQIDRWLLSQDEPALLDDERWTLVLYSRNEDAVESVGRLARRFIESLAEELGRASPKDGISAGSHHRSDALPLLAKHYSDALPEEEWKASIVELLRGSMNAHCYAGHKASLFGNVALTLRRVTPAVGYAVASELGNRHVATEEARTLPPSRLWRACVDMPAVRARLVELRASVGIEPDASDLDVLLVALQTRDDENLTHALWVASYLGARPWNTDVLAGAVFQHLTGANKQANASALWCALENNLFVGTALERVAFDRVAAHVQSDEAYVARTALYWLGRDKTVIPNAVRANALDATRSALTSNHAGVRDEARKALAKLGEPT